MIFKKPVIYFKEFQWKSKQALLPFGLFIILATILFWVFLPSENDISKKTFNRLEKIRIDKKKRVLKKLEHLKEKTQNAHEDPMLMSIFNKLRREGFTQRFSNFERSDMLEMDKHYVKEYAGFYDILFIRNDGLVFYSLKLENDFKQNIFAGDIAKTKLSRSLKKFPGIRFIDFGHYSPSKEPAAFFVKRITSNGNTLGWIAFQLSLNAINSIMIAKRDPEIFGQTGEVYLVNEAHMMLTDSRFIDKRSSLQRKVETEAIKMALNNEKGELVTEDYRGIRVFSSVEKFDFENTTWVIVVEIDEDEVITEAYEKNKSQYIPKIYAHLSKGSPIDPVDDGFNEGNIRVDINEYSKGQAGNILMTHGVTTCTGIVFSLPGEFTYLGHIYPLDESYYSWMDKIILDMAFKFINNPHGDGIVDLMGEMIHRIKYYDVYPYEIRKLSVLIVAVHTESFEKIIDRLLDAGLFLSQIKVLYYPRMKNANITTNVSKSYTAIKWLGKGGVTKEWTDAESVEDLGSLVKNVSGYSS